MTQSRESRNQKGHKKSILILLWSSCTHTSSPSHHQNWQKSIKPCYHSKHNENFYSDLYYSFKGVRYVENGWLVLFALCQIVNMKTIKYLKSQGKMKACFQLITSYSADKPLQMSIFTTKPFIGLLCTTLQAFSSARVDWSSEGLFNKLRAMSTIDIKEYFFTIKIHKWHLSGFSPSIFAL